MVRKKLTAKELGLYKDKLLELKDKATQQMKDISQDTLMKSQKDMSGDISGYSLHMADVASDNYDREFNLGLVSGERDVIIEIEQAIKRIDDKSFGSCLCCKKSISKTRLNALPYAKYCIDCQEKKDKER